MGKFIKLVGFMGISLLFGCAGAPVDTKLPKKEKEYPVMQIEIKQLVGGNPRVKAYAVLTPEANTCVIYLRKYPQCLQHEVRHCFEGNWHPNEKHNTEDC